MDQSILRKARRRLLRMHFESGVGHLGGNLSCLDIIMTLYHDVMKPEDVFILSKGHSAGALYVTLWSNGILNDSDLQTFHAEGTQLPGHPPCNRFPDIPFGTGSLGHGVSLACGLALAKKLKGETGRVYVLTSDGEWNEGSCWEALMFAVHNWLENLTIIVDHNGLQGMGFTWEESGIGRFIPKFSSFGATVIDVPLGYPMDDSLRAHCDTPLCVIINTKKGQCVSFMENKYEWHYKPMTAEQYAQALAENPE